MGRKDFFDEFLDKCIKICDILSHINIAYNNLVFFRMLDDKVYGYGNRVNADGEIEEFVETFPVEYLFLSEEELQNVVNNKFQKTGGTFNNFQL